MLTCSIMGATAPRLSVVVSTAALLLVTLIRASSALPTSSNISSTSTSTGPCPVFFRDDNDNDDDDYIRPDDRLHRRDFTWRTTHDEPSHVCGNSTFGGPTTYQPRRGPRVLRTHLVDDDDDDDDENEGGPLVWDCQTFVNSSKTMNGTWLVNDFGSKGENWVEFSRVQSCRVSVRHSDGGTGTIPIGNQDVIDLLSSVMARNPGRTTLPWISTGDMMCERGETRAAVEWKVSSSQAAAV